MGRERPVSLMPLDFGQAIDGLLAVPPKPKPAKKKAAKKPAPKGSRKKK